jgi:hypothetical protein
VVDPESETVTVWQPGATPEEFAAPQMVSAAPVLRDFQLDLRELFDSLRD